MDRSRKKEAEDLFKLGKNYKEIALKINRSKTSVASLLRNMGYSYRLPQFWTEKQINYLRENYKNTKYADIGKRLRRTTKAVSAKAEELDFQKRLIKNKKDV